MARQLLERGGSLLAGLGRGPQLALLGLAGLVAVLVVVAMRSVSEGPYVPLFAGLSAEDTSAIVAQLRASKTPHRLAGAGDQILVPAAAADEARLRLAVQGAPIGAGIGFEVFDKTAFGVSDFSQRVNYQRALQGELARTIGHLKPVARARVHLVLPQPSLFAERERPPSASVFLQLRPGGRLSGEQVRGIVHLVASSVEGLGPERVTVVDTAGQVLAAGADGAPGGLSPRRLELKTAVEEHLERRIQGLLDAALGPGQALARVSARVNLDQVERTEERFDPAPVARQETRSTESNKTASSTPSAAVVPPPGGAPAQPAPPPPAPSTSSSEGSRESRTVSYEISRTVARTLTAPGDLRRLSVAVLLRMPKGGAQAGGAPAAPRPAEEIEKIKRMVMGAVGYDADRGDQVTVVEIPADVAVPEPATPAAEPAPPAPPARMADPVLVGGAAAALVVLGVAVWLWRRRARARALTDVVRTLQGPATPAAPRTGTAVPAVAAMEGSGADPLSVPEEFVRLGRERDGLRQQALDLATGEPAAAAQLIRAWMVKKRALEPGGGAAHAG